MLLSRFYEERCSMVDMTVTLIETVKNRNNDDGDEIDE